MSDRNIAIQVRGLGKKYRIGGPHEKYYTFRDAITSTIRAPLRRLSGPAPSEEFWALKDVSFDIEAGEVVGIIGRNGAGKSTLLKILSRITSPTEGTVDLYGRVGSLLEVGTGFHPELTGRENIFLSGSILGMKKREIEDKLDDIVKFSEIEKFLDTPAKRYSSGMYVRLAFAVAAHLEPEILLVDEVLAVGDAAFQKKCLGKMGDIAKEGRTVLFVSHNMEAIRNICKRGLMLDRGEMKIQGDISEVVSDYLYSVSERKESSVFLIPSGDTTISFTSVSILDEKGISRNHFRIFEKINIEMKYRVNHRISGANIAIVVSWRNSTVFTSYDTDLSEHFLDWREPGEYRAKFPMPSKILKPGHYSVRIVAGMLGTGIIKDLGDILSFTIDHDEKGSAAKSYAENRDGIIVCNSPWDIERIG